MLTETDVHTVSWPGSWRWDEDTDVYYPIKTAHIAVVEGSNICFKRPEENELPLNEIICSKLFNKDIKETISVNI